MIDRYAVPWEAILALRGDDTRAAALLSSMGTEGLILTRRTAPDLLARLVEELRGHSLMEMSQTYVVYSDDKGWQLVTTSSRGSAWEWLDLPGTEGATSWLEAVGLAAVAWANEHARHTIVEVDGVLGLGQRWHHLLTSTDGGPWQEVAHG